MSKVDNLWTSGEVGRVLISPFHLITGLNISPQPTHYLSTIIRKLSTILTILIHKRVNLEDGCLKPRISLMLPTALTITT